jgi:23S rRNA (pseudouridine1915-N3)-methyltransferase
MSHWEPTSRARPSGELMPTKISVVAVGRLKERHWREAAEEYLKRLTPYAAMSVAEVPDRDVSRDETAALTAEGAGVLKALDAVPGPPPHVVALDLGGRSLSSEQFAEWLAEGDLAGRSSVAFVIGGAAGHAPQVLARADERLSFGPMTLPHQMARVVLLEQLYRAFRIMRGEPYHR